MATNKVTVTNIGTCRIAEPLAAAKRLKSVKRAIDNIYGFVHTTKEALQQIGFCEGEMLPKELAPYLCSKGSFPSWKKEGPSDFYFVEISSTKEIHFDGFLLQLNYLDTSFAERPELSKTFFRLYRESDKEKRAAELAALPAFANATSLEKRILLEGYVHQTSFEELRQDMLEITERLEGEVIFVGHINVLGNDGAPIASRAKLSGWLQEIAEADGYTLYDPTPLVLEYGRERALEDNGRDVNHYTAEFKEYYGKTLVRQFVEAKGRQRRVKPVRTQVNLPVAGALSVAAAESGAKPALTKVAISAMVAKISGAMKLGEIEEASRLAEELMGIDQHTYKSAFMIAKVLLKGRRLSEAAEWLEQASDLAPDATIPLSELVRCYQKLKAYDRIITTVDRIFALDGESAELLVSKREAYIKLGDDAGIAAVSLQLVGRDAEAAFSAAASLASHGKFEAVASLIAACKAANYAGADDAELQAKCVKGLLRGAKVAIEAGDTATATAAWRAILLLEPEHEHAISRLARLVAAECGAAKELMQAQDMNGALAAYGKALEHNPSDVRALRGFARCCDQVQDSANSAMAWERLGVLGFDAEFSFRRAARFAARAGDVTKALRMYGKIELTELDGDAQTSIASLVRKAVKAARLALDAGNTLEACSNAEAVLNVEPLHAEILQLLRTAQVEFAKQSVEELPSASRLFARRMVGEIHVILREADQRAAKWNMVSEAASQAA